MNVYVCYSVECHFEGVGEISWIALHWLVTNIFINVLIAYFRGQDSYSYVDNHNCCNLFNDLQIIIFSKCKITYLNAVLLSLQ